MKVIEYNDKFFRYLKELDAHFSNSLIGIKSIKEIAEEDIDRIIKNNWQTKNKFVYVINSINSSSIKNIMNLSELVMGYAIDTHTEDERIITIYNYIQSINKDCYITYNLKDFCNKYNIEPTKYYGGIYDVS